MAAINKELDNLEDISLRAFSCNELCNGSTMDIATLLASKKIDVEQYDIDDRTALMHLSEMGSLHKVSTLILHGANVNATNNYGETALLYASINGHLKVVTILLSYGANVNATNKDGNTALLYASRNGHLNVVTILLSHGADVNVTNKDGETAYSISVDYKHNTITELLVSKGAIPITILTYKSYMNEIETIRLEKISRVAKWEKKFIATKRFIDVNKKFPYDYEKILNCNTPATNKDKERTVLIRSLTLCNYTLRNGEKCEKELSKMYDKKDDPYKCYHHSTKMCPNCIHWTDSQGGTKKYDGYCARCFKHIFPHDPRSIMIREHTKELLVRNAITMQSVIDPIYSGFIHDQPLFTGNCDCTHRRRIDHRKLIGNTILAIETDEFAHKGYNETDEEIRYDDLYMIHSGKWIFIRFNPDATKNNKTPLDKRICVLLQTIEQQVQRIEHETNTELVEIIKLYY